MWTRLEGAIDLTRVVRYPLVSASPLHSGLDHCTLFLAFPDTLESEYARSIRRRRLTRCRPWKAPADSCQLESFEALGNSRRRIHQYRSITIRPFLKLLAQSRQGAKTSMLQNTPSGSTKPLPSLNFTVSSARNCPRQEPNNSESKSLDVDLLDMDMCLPCDDVHPPFWEVCGEPNPLLWSSQTACSNIQNSFQLESTQATSEVERRLT